jgi:hypothetical protein
MLGIALAMAAAAVPQTTTPQGNGHHANDDRRPTDEAPLPSTKSRNKRKADPAGEVRKNPDAPAESRESDGVLMPGAPGTNDPTIPGGGSSGT